MQCIRWTGIVSGSNFSQFLQTIIFLTIFSYIKNRKQAFVQARKEATGLPLPQYMTNDIFVWKLVKKLLRTRQHHPDKPVEDAMEDTLLRSCDLNIHI